MKKIRGFDFRVSKFKTKSTIPEFAAVNATTLRMVKMTASFIILICV